MHRAREHEICTHAHHSDTPSSYIDCSVVSHVSVSYPFPIVLLFYQRPRSLVGPLFLCAPVIGVTLCHAAVWVHLASVIWQRHGLTQKKRWVDPSSSSRSLNLCDCSTAKGTSMGPPRERVVSVWRARLPACRFQLC
jgi:hypothetical protein